MIGRLRVEEKLLLYLFKFPFLRQLIEPFAIIINAKVIFGDMAIFYQLIGKFFILNCEIKAVAAVSILTIVIIVNAQ